MRSYEVTIEADDSWEYDEVKEMTTQELVEHYPWGKVVFEADGFEGMEWTVDLKHISIKPIY